jgi:hypothetical protein
MADYGCHPLWAADDDGTRNVSPDELPLSAELRAALAAWARAFDATLNHEYPPDSGFRSAAEENDFETEGRRLWNHLRAQLGGAYRVVFFSARESRLLE